jgi:hypothetical protein
VEDQERIAHDGKCAHSIFVREVSHGWEVLEQRDQGFDAFHDRDGRNAISFMDIGEYTFDFGQRGL